MSVEQELETIEWCIQKIAVEAQEGASLQEVERMTKFFSEFIGFKGTVLRVMKKKRCAV